VPHAVDSYCPTPMDQPTPKPNAPSPVGASMEEYLTISEVAARLKISPKTLRNKMAAGVFCKGVHYVRPNGLGTRFKWGAVVAWLEQEDTGTPDVPVDAIPMARGYELGEPRKKTNFAGSLT
jgi:hypothetical protein